MKQLWAPWRLEYILGQKESKDDAICVFCKVADEEPRLDNLLLFKNSAIMVLFNKFPYAPGHLLVLPRAHVAKPNELNHETVRTLASAKFEVVKILESALNPHGFNIGLNLGRAAGAGIPDHLHWHVVPRWGGDTNFMPVIGEIKCLPTHIRTLYEKLHPLFFDFAKRIT